MRREIGPRNLSKLQDSIKAPSAQDLTVIPASSFYLAIVDMIQKRVR